jgi:hypothetical protein
MAGYWRVPGQHAGDRPEPAVAERAAGLLHQSADDGLPAHDRQVLVARLPVGARELIGRRGADKAPSAVAPGQLGQGLLGNLEAFAATDVTGALA